MHPEAASNIQGSFLPPPRHTPSNAILSIKYTVIFRRAPILHPNAIKETRKKQHVTQEELAEDAGVSIASIRRIERDDTSPDDKRVTYDTLLRVAFALEIPSDELSPFQRDNILTLTRAIRQQAEEIEKEIKTDHN